MTILLTSFVHLILVFSMLFSVSISSISPLKNLSKFVNSLLFPNSSFQSSNSIRSSLGKFHNLALKVLPTVTSGPGESQTNVGSSDHPRFAIFIFEIILSFYQHFYRDTISRRLPTKAK